MSTTNPTLRLRSRPECVGIARAFVVSTARVLGAEPDSIEGLRLAVSELATLLVTSGDGSFEIGVASRDGRIVVEMTPEDTVPTVPGEIETIVRRGIDGVAELDGDRWVLSIDGGS